MVFPINMTMITIHITSFFFIKVLINRHFFSLVQTILVVTSALFSLWTQYNSGEKYNATAHLHNTHVAVFVALDLFIDSSVDCYPTVEFCPNMD